MFNVFMLVHQAKTCLTENTVYLAIFVRLTEEFNVQVVSADHLFFLTKCLSRFMRIILSNLSFFIF